MSINGIVAFLHELFYATFEILPILGQKTNYFFWIIITVLFFYWLRVLASTPKKS